ncbi:28662_t:CDS:1, partial [Gigaspora margarita]
RVGILYVNSYTNPKIEGPTKSRKLFYKWKANQSRELYESLKIESYTE